MQPSVYHRRRSSLSPTETIRAYRHNRSLRRVSEDTGQPLALVRLFCDLCEWRQNASVGDSEVFRVDDSLDGSDAAFMMCQSLNSNGSFEFVYVQSLRIMHVRFVSMERSFFNEVKIVGLEHGLNT